MSLVLLIKESTAISLIPVVAVALVAIALFIYFLFKAAKASANIPASSDEADLGQYNEWEAERKPPEPPEI